MASTFANDSAVLGYELRVRRIVYLGQTLKFRAPVFVGDTVTAKATVKNVREDKPVVTIDTTCFNQNGDTVVEGEQQALSDAQLAEVWLRQVDTSPGSFLRYKFAYQAQAAGTAEAAQ